MVKTTISSYHSKMVETTKKQIAISDSLCYHFFVVVITIHFLECISIKYINDDVTIALSCTKTRLGGNT